MAKTFSAPVELLKRADEKARAEDMTPSGFYRYCIAKECGYSPEEAKALAVHGAVLVARERAVRYPEHRPQNIALNDDPSSTPKTSLGTLAAAGVAKAKTAFPKAKQKPPTDGPTGGKP